MLWKDDDSAATQVSHLTPQSPCCVDFCLLCLDMYTRRWEHVDTASRTTPCILTLASYWRLLTPRALRSPGQDTRAPPYSVRASRHHTSHTSTQVFAHRFRRIPLFIKMCIRPRSKDCCCSKGCNGGDEELFTCCGVSLIQSSVLFPRASRNLLGGCATLTITQ